MKAYLYFNAAIYAVFALWCTVSPWRTAAAVGYPALDAGGRSEYLVVYGGLQLGLALIFALLARGDKALVQFGLLASLCLYGPLVLYRAITVARFWPQPPLTIAVGVLETGLLAAAALLYVRARGA